MDGKFWEYNILGNSNSFQIYSQYIWVFVDASHPEI